MTWQDRSDSDTLERLDAVLRPGKQHYRQTRYHGRLALPQRAPRASGWRRSLAPAALVLALTIVGIVWLQTEIQLTSNFRRPNLAAFSMPARPLDTAATQQLREVLTQGQRIARPGLRVGSSRLRWRVPKRPQPSDSARKRPGQSVERRADASLPA